MVSRKSSEGNGITVTQGGGNTRGWRNKNPLNVRYSPANDWIGQVGNDGAFCTFDSFENGLRAAVKILSKYYTDYNLQTVGQILARFAPFGDGNNPERYAQTVASLTGLGPAERVDSLVKAAKLVKAMAYVESRIEISTDSAANAVGRYRGVGAFGG